jgi:molecular chaperone DnaK (HSP70)
VHPHQCALLLCVLLLQVLSANAESTINIECLMDDVDVKSELNREQLEEMIAPFLGRLQAVLRSALESSGARCSSGGGHS